MSSDTTKSAFTALDTNSGDGAFKRKDAAWRSWISSEPEAKFAPEANRYHLYLSHACPWAHRTNCVRVLKGLDNIIGITFVHPTWQMTKPDQDEHKGWVFGKEDAPTDEFISNTDGFGKFPLSWGQSEPFYNGEITTIRGIYEKAKDTTGLYSVPVLWDKKLETIVSNESSEIIRMLNSEFNDLATNPELDLYPKDKRGDIDAMNDWIYPTINNGVYRCGFAKSQEAYDVAIDELTKSFDKIDSILQKQRFIAGDTFTEADVRLFVTLLRFDEVYIVYFKTNTRSVASTPSILNYLREIYQMKGITETCNMDMIKAHYFTSHAVLNKYAVIPRGDSFTKLLEQPHNRDSL